MVLDNSHIIHKVFVEVDTDSLSSGNQFKDSFLEYLKDKILPLLDTKLTEVSAKTEGFQVRIPHLEVDVSIDKSNNFRGIELDVVTKVEQRVEKTIEKDLLQENSFDEPVLISSSKNKEQLFKEFLRTGASPWWELKNLTNFKSEEFLEFVKPAYLQSIEVKERFIKQFDNDFLLKTVLRFNKDIQEKTSSGITSDKVEKIYTHIIEKVTDVKQRFLVWDILLSEYVNAKGIVSLREKLKVFLHRFLIQELEAVKLEQYSNDSVNQLLKLSNDTSLRFYDEVKNIDSKKSRLKLYLIDRILTTEQSMDALVQIPEEINKLQKELKGIERKIKLENKEENKTELSFQDKAVKSKQDTVLDKTNSGENNIEETRSAVENAGEEKELNSNVSENEINGIVHKLKAYGAFMSEFDKELSILKKENVAITLNGIKKLLIEEWGPYFTPMKLERNFSDEKFQISLFELNKLVETLDSIVIENKSLLRKDKETEQNRFARLIALINELNQEIKRSLIQFLENDERDIDLLEFFGSDKELVSEMLPKEVNQSSSFLQKINPFKNKNGKNEGGEDDKKEAASEEPRDSIQSRIKTEKHLKEVVQGKDTKKHETNQGSSTDKIVLKNEELFQIEQGIFGSENHESSILNLELKPEMYVENAGVILTHPFLKFLLINRELYDEETQKITNPEKAIHLIHFVATGKEQDLESNMVFEKIICGISPDQPINRFIYLSEEDKQEAENMIQAVLSNWEKMNNASIDLLRYEFFNRNGKLTTGKKTVSLKIERKPQDLLLNKINWNMSMVKLPWLTTMIQVEW
ncbi:contractile injection system tape measure protein [Tenacibaculum xiamenense]|uniref:contractile injection system tape measure protein n=1 Tax=Tenacibaculum xiamenense TaxID=1261553 RepID=UPI00389374B8